MNYKYCIFFSTLGNTRFICIRPSFTFARVQCRNKDGTRVHHVSSTRVVLIQRHADLPADTSKAAFLPRRRSEKIMRCQLGRTCEYIYIYIYIYIYMSIYDSQWAIYDSRLMFEYEFISGFIRILIGILQLSARVSSPTDNNTKRVTKFAPTPRCQVINVVIA